MSQMLLEDVLNCPSLPSLPAVASKLIELTGDPDVQMSEIAKTVQQDQALAGKVLKTVNSSYYGLANRCGSIERAMGYLGLNTVKSLVLGFSLVETTGNMEGEGFDLIGHWRRTLLGATASRTLAKTFRISDKDEVFTAALFQDMGMLANFAAMKDRYVEVVGGVDHGQLFQIEQEKMGFTHAQVGSELAKKWCLPENISDAINHHHDPEKASKGDIEMIRAVSLGTQVAEALSANTPQSSIRRIESQTASWFPKQKLDIEALFEEVNEAAKELATLFETEIGELKNVHTLMSQAQEQGLEHQISMQRENESLAKQTMTDGMTGIANRKAFDIKISEAHEQFVQSGTAYAVLFFDADKFKSVNDTHGHAAGDLVLIELAKRASQSIENEGTVCRYGGEEFGVILPGYGTLKAAMLAERLRSEIGSKPFDLRSIDEGPDELPVTVSVGVSATDSGPTDRLSKPDQLVIESDAGVYAAKEAGRNNVQVWSPELGKESKSSVQKIESAKPTIPTGDGTLKHIILIEDDALAATLVMTLLERVSKAKIQWIQDGNQARDYLKRMVERNERPGDVMICDLDLPGCSGFDVYREFQELGLDGLMSFFILTNQDCEATSAEASKLGIAECISKGDLAKNLGKWIKVFTKVPAAAA